MERKEGLMLLRRLFEFIAPAACVGCEREGGLICAGCLRTVAVHPACCYSCNSASELGRTCGECRTRAGLAGVTVAAAYDGVAKELIWRLKFQRVRAAAEPLAAMLAKRLSYEPMVVTAVPIAPVRYRERGYNQSDLIARQLARRLGRPYLPSLGRTTNEHQVGRSRSERLEQVRGAFYATRRLHGERVLIVDDVITTGATLGECAAMLREAGAGEVWGAAVARH